MRNLPSRCSFSAVLIGVMLAQPVLGAYQAFACSLLPGRPAVKRPIPRPPHRVRYATAERLAQTQRVRAANLTRNPPEFASDTDTKHACLSAAGRAYNAFIDRAHGASRLRC